MVRRRTRTRRSGRQSGWPRYDATRPGAGFVGWARVPRHCALSAGRTVPWRRGDVLGSCAKFWSGWVCVPRWLLHHATFTPITAPPSQSRCARSPARGLRSPPTKFGRASTRVSFALARPVRGPNTGQRGRTAASWATTSSTILARSPSILMLFVRWSTPKSVTRTSRRATDALRARDLQFDR